mmetsp:Transcript_52006/g.173572  ORF Transcript_52006/g.173572 Transcript_52006/m.173572 type:complete len:330 (-) Transcript_52006:28-1017(-)
MFVLVLRSAVLCVMALQSHLKGTAHDDVWNHTLALASHPSHGSAWPTTNYPQCPERLAANVGCDYVSSAPRFAVASIERILDHLAHGEKPQFSSGVYKVNKRSEQINRLRMKLLLLWHTLERLRPAAPSAVVELGCFVGTTTMGLRMVMDALGFRAPGHLLHCFDSWQGLPAPTDSDMGTSSRKGSLTASMRTYTQRFRASGLDLPVLHSGFFGDIPSSEYPDRIAYAYFDSDLYESIMQSFNRTYDKMLPGGTIVVDDYLFEGFKGVKPAVDEFLEDKPEGQRTPLLLATKTSHVVPRNRAGRKGEALAGKTRIPFQFLEGVIEIAST